MQKIQLNYSTTVIQKFFIEKTLELLNVRTLDTYRLRLNNPKTAICELVNITKDVQDNKLKQNEYITCLANEVKRILTKDHYLKFNTISEKYFISLIDKIANKDYSKLILSGEIILKENSNYFSALHLKLQKTLKKYETTQNIVYKDVEDFDRLLQYYYIELISLGYSKYFLTRFTRDIFLGIPNLSFYDRLDILKNLKNRKKEKFQILFGFKSMNLGLENIKIDSKNIKNIDRRDRKIIESNTNIYIKEFIESNKENLLLEIERKEIDYYKALESSKIDIFRFFDVLHLSYSNKEINLIDEFAVIGENEPSKARLYSQKYKMEGFYANSIKIYQQYIEKFNSISNNKKIHTETKNKIFSAFRYLRLGTDSNDLGNKLLNYWIGLEFIFSSYDADAYAIGRMRQYFKKCHALAYIKRNLREFHKDIKLLGLDTIIINYNEKMKYLLDPKTYDNLVNQNISSLISFRAQYFKELINDSKKVRGVIEKHQQDLDWNLLRIYRIRNEIVHNAAIRIDITSIVSHLRYYLTFILNSIMDFLINNPLDINRDGIISIEDFFIFHELKLSSLEENNDNFTLERFLEYENPIEIIT